MTHATISGLLRTVGPLAAVAVLGDGIAVGQTVYTWTGVTNSDWGTSTNWSTPVALTDGEYGDRINVTGGQTLLYTSALGDTIYNASGTLTPTFGRGLVLSNTSSFEVQSGSFTSDGGQATIIALNAGTSTLTVSGGSFTSGNLDVGFGGGGNGIVNVTGGTMTAAELTVGSSGSRAVRHQPIARLGGRANEAGACRGGGRSGRAQRRAPSTSRMAGSSPPHHRRRARSRTARPAGPGFVEREHGSALLTALCLWLFE
ncbi:MAG: hypothetical protein WD072_06655 [Pirellulales bacterium]